jgi:hypothetical protein
MAGPGGDNVTGDRYTLDLGVEPDMGDLLSNLRLANDLLDQSQQKFQIISDTVASATQRLSAMARQTELVATGAQRIQNAMQLAAVAGGTLGNIGAMAVGGYGMGGYMPPYMPGQMAFAGMPGTMPAMQPAAPGGPGYGYGAAGTTGEDIMEAMPPPPLSQVGGGIPATMRLNQMQAYFEHFGRFANPLRNFRTTAAAPPGTVGTPPMPGSMAEAMPPAPGMLEEAMGTAGDLGGTALAANAMAGTGGVVGTLAATAADLVPYFAAYQGIKKAYEIFQKGIQETTRITGMTGGTSVGEMIGMKAGQKVMGFLHPEIGSGNMAKIQEQVLSQGYLYGSDTFNEVQGYMMEAYKRGLGETIDQLALYLETVDKAGGSMGDLTSAMDEMRMVARNTNASLTIMATNYKQNVETFVGMGMGGSAASFAARSQSESWAQTGVINPALRNYQGIDMTNPLIRASIAEQAGVSYANVPLWMVTNPNAGVMAPVMAEEAVIARLRQIGLKPGMTPQEMNSIMPLEAIGTFLVNAGVLTPEDGGDVDTILDYMNTIWSKPVGTHTAEILKQMQGHTIQATVATTRASSETVKGAPAAGAYLERLGLNAPGRTPEGQVEYDPGSPIANWYFDFVTRTGKNVPVLDRIIKSGDDVNHTYVKTAGGDPLPLNMWMTEHPDATIDDFNALQFTTMSEEQASKMHWDKSKRAIVNNTGSKIDFTSDLDWSSSATKMGLEAPSESAEKTIVAGTVSINEGQFKQLLDALDGSWSSPAG